ncbi:MAG: glycoside hydrolase family 13 protein [Streptococcaceae bacterium]|jgi:alpha-glucosidase|nr:glycoside hydrolase family 13 protein [Streptococcaceae bacterium]
MYYYNPWQKDYKDPFGAVATDHEMRLRFASDLENVEVKLVIHRDFGPRYEFELVKSDGHFFETTVKFDRGPALYFYHFEITEATDWGTKRLYYGSTPSGGEGQIVENESDVLNYQVTVFEDVDKAPTWYREAVFYQIFPDRFANGNADGHVNHPKKNSFLYATEEDEPFYVKNEAGDIVRWDFYGGNLRGILEKLDYLEELGVNAIYLNPIFHARSNHRYDTMDYLQIDPMLGTEEDFRVLVDALHARGMHIVLDGVFSHVGQDSRYFNLLGTFGEDEGAAKRTDSPYYSWFKFNEWPRDYKAWWGIKDLPEVDKDNQSFRDFIYGAENSVLAKWNSFGVDGWRLDVADELPDDFIRGIRDRLNHDEVRPEQILIGEVWEDASNKISYEHRRDYILGGSLEGVMNYPVREMIIDYVDGNITAQDVAYRLMTLRENYPRDIFYNNLNNIGTHDTERILTMVGDDNIALAVGLLFMLPGVPCVYYGDEAGLTGRKDPSNRKFFPWEKSHGPIEEVYKRWIHRRKDYVSLKWGEFNVGFEGGIIAILRHVDDNRTLLYLVNPGYDDVYVRFGEIEWMRNQAFTGDVLHLEDLEIPAKSDWFGAI